MHRFLINLRSLDVSSTQTTSEAQHFSRFSMLNFQVPGSILGNIGELLEYEGQPDDAAIRTDVAFNGDDTSPADEEARQASVSGDGP